MDKLQMAYYYGVIHAVQDIRKEIESGADVMKTLLLMEASASIRLSSVPSTVEESVAIFNTSITITEEVRHAK